MSLLRYQQTLMPEVFFFFFNTRGEREIINFREEISNDPFKQIVRQTIFDTRFTAFTESQFINKLKFSLLI